MLMEEPEHSESMKLVKPTIELKQEYLEMVDEWKQSNEKIVPRVNEDTLRHSGRMSKGDWKLLFDRVFQYVRITIGIVQ